MAAVEEMRPVPGMVGDLRPFVLSVDAASIKPVWEMGALDRLLLLLVQCAGIICWEYRIRQPLLIDDMTVK